LKFDEPSGDEDEVTRRKLEDRQKRDRQISWIFIIIMHAWSGLYNNNSEVGDKERLGDVGVSSCCCFQLVDLVVYLVLIRYSGVNWIQWLM